MTAQLNRELLEKTIADWESARNEIPFGLGEEGNNALAALKFALAVMDSEPVAVPDEREAFEAWVKFHLDDEHSIVTLHRANGGLNYRDPHVDLAWIAWKESRAAMLKAGPVTAATVPDGLASSVKCWCRTCRPVDITDMRFVVCPDCGNKRCPRANDHRNACSGSNEPGQDGSAYPAAPEQQNAQQNIPENIPGGWIKCSERMPETDGNYWGWWSESKRQGPVWFIKSYLQAQFQSSEITHWMPLPAAPEQEV